MRKNYPVFDSQYFPTIPTTEQTHLLSASVPVIPSSLSNASSPVVPCISSLFSSFSSSIEFSFLVHSFDLLFILSTSKLIFLSSSFFDRDTISSSSPSSSSSSSSFPSFSFEFISLYFLLMTSYLHSISYILIQKRIVTFDSKVYFQYQQPQRQQQQQQEQQEQMHHPQDEDDERFVEEGEDDDGEKVSTWLDFFHNKFIPFSFASSSSSSSSSSTPSYSAQFHTHSSFSHSSSSFLSSLLSFSSQLFIYFLLLTTLFQFCFLSFSASSSTSSSESSSTFFLSSYFFFFQGVHYFFLSCSHLVLSFFLLSSVSTLSIFCCCFHFCYSLLNFYLYHSFSFSFSLSFIPFSSSLCFLLLFVNLFYFFFFHFLFDSTYLFPILDSTFIQRFDALISFASFWSIIILFFRTVLTFPSPALSSSLSFSFSSLFHFSLLPFLSLCCFWLYHSTASLFNVSFLHLLSKTRKLSILHVCWVYLHMLTILSLTGISSCQMNLFNSFFMNENSGTSSQILYYLATFLFSLTLFFFLSSSSSSSSLPECLECDLIWIPLIGLSSFALAQFVYFFHALSFLFAVLVPLLYAFFSDELDPLALLLSHISLLLLLLLLTSAHIFFNKCRFSLHAKHVYAATSSESPPVYENAVSSSIPHSRRSSFQRLSATSVPNVTSYSHRSNYLAVSPLRNEQEFDDEERKDSRQTLPLLMASSSGTVVEVKPDGDIYDVLQALLMNDV